MSQDAPGNAGQLVGQGRCQLVLVHPFGGLCQPGAEAELLPVFGSHQDDLGCLNEQCSQIFAAALRDAPEDRFAARAVLARHQPQPGSEVTATFKSFALYR